MCTSSKMRKRMAFRMQEEAKQLKGLFKDLVRLVPTITVGNLKSQPLNPGWPWNFQGQGRGWYSELLEKRNPSLRWRRMIRAYVSTDQRGQEGATQGLAAAHFCVWVQTSVRHLGWQQDATALRRKFLFPSACQLWCCSGMAPMVVTAEGQNVASVERENKQEKEGINSCLNTISYF